MLRIGVAVALLLASTALAQDCWSVTTAAYPRQYVAYYAQAPPVLDGRVVGDPFWDAVPFTEAFVDISTATKPTFETRAKIRFDRDWLYVGAVLEEHAVWANITHTCHCIDPIHDQVIFHDNDFEVFVDADGSCAYYKEYEQNAANANWDLCLNRPYENSGYENSTRVFGPRGFDMVPPLRSAVHIDGCVLNRPGACRSWSVEIAFPLAALAYNTSAAVPPDAGARMWRINFSRVEWAVRIVQGRYVKQPSCQSCPVPGSAAEDNWVWSPMRAIDMHHPELWGFLQFSYAPPNTTAPRVSSEWPALFAAHELYYAQVAFFQRYGSYASRVSALLPFAHFPIVLEGGCAVVRELRVAANATRYVAVIAASGGVAASTLSIDENRHIRYAE